MTMTIECYICGLGLDDVEVHDDDWRLSNIDGANVPLCYGCIDKQFEYASCLLYTSPSPRDRG